MFKPPLIAKEMTPLLQDSYGKHKYVWHLHLGNEYLCLDDNQKSIPSNASETGTQNIHVSMSDVYLHEKGTYDKTIINSSI